MQLILGLFFCTCQNVSSVLVYSELHLISTATNNACFISESPCSIFSRWNILTRYVQLEKQLSMHMDAHILHQARGSPRILCVSGACMKRTITHKHVHVSSEFPEREFQRVRKATAGWHSYLRPKGTRKEFHKQPSNKLSMLLRYRREIISNDGGEWWYLCACVCVMYYIVAESSRRGQGVMVRGNVATYVLICLLVYAYICVHACVVI